MVIGKKTTYGRYMLYRAGWFVLIDDKDNSVAIMTREDARHAEADSNWYGYRMNCDRGGMPEDPALEKKYYDDPVTGRLCYKGKYEVDDLGDPSLDVKIGKTLVIPEYVGEFRVNYIFENTFQFLDIESLVLPDSIKSIQRYAFRYCAYLNDVKMAPDVEIDKSAFKDCPAFMDANGLIVTDTSVVQADNSAPKHLIVPPGITAIERGSFKGIRSVSEITIPEGCTFIGVNAFAGCERLEKINFPSHMEEIEAGAFSNCTSLKSIHFPDGITYLSREVCLNCESLEEVTIPASVTDIQGSAFSNTKLEKDYLNSDDHYCYAGSWLITYKTDYVEELKIKDGTVGVASQTLHWPTFDKLVLPPSLKYLCYNAFCHSHVKELDLGNVESIGFAALTGNDCTSITFPKTCKNVSSHNIGRCSFIEDVYFMNPDTVIA
ncbi:MAG: leucine-rich repeat protein, partial [Lachnospiraceae bacterium]|nr:leucine-rich repeat protein [Lachnospiraceae bacterium]